MILFCEECGQRNNVTLTPSLVESNSFTCQFCHFLSPFPFLDSEKKSTSNNSGITYLPEILHFGPEMDNEEQSFPLTFTIADIQDPEIKVEPFRHLDHLITVNKKAPDSFTITVKPLGKGKEKSIPPGYTGPGIIFCEEKLMSWGTITLSREKQSEQMREPEPEPAVVPVPASNRRSSTSVFHQNPSKITENNDVNILHQQLADYKSQLHQAKTTSFRMQKELSIRRQVMDSQHCGILFINMERRIVYANPVFLDKAGYSLKAIQTKRIHQVVMLTDPDLNLKEVMKEALRQGEWEGKAFLKEAVHQGNWQGKSANGKNSDEQQNSASTISFKYTHGDEDGHEKGFVCLLHPEQDEGNLTPSSTLSIGQGGTVNPQANHLSTEISYDALTGLADRPSFQQYLEDSIQLAGDDPGRIGLLYIDIDHFKRINQIFGPGFGDKILCSVSTILQQCAQEAGANMVARLSGDEFAIILPPPADKEVAEQLSQQIMQRFITPVNDESRAILIRPSIGYCIYPDDGDTPLDLLRNADTAMEAAKSEGGNRVSSWNSGMKVQAAQSLYLENDLRQAVADDSMINFYQPQIDLTNGSICGMEALARWIHPVRGLISPVAFIPICESTGLIEKLGIDLVRQACAQGKKWRDMGFRRFIMAVNISGRLLRRRDLFYQIMSCVESTGFPPEWLEVEFTEGVLIENMDFTVDLVGKLRAEGIKLAIDDFGTGYSSLSYLQHLQVDKIKIDRSFITNVTTNNTDAAITLGIIAIARNLHFRVIAEGIETEEHLFFLQRNQCNEGQGFLFSKPIPEKEMTSLLLRDSSVALNHKRMIDKFYTIKA